MSKLNRMHLEKLVLYLRFEMQECSAVKYCPVLCVEKLSKKQQTSAIYAERSAVQFCWRCYLTEDSCLKSRNLLTESSSSLSTGREFKAFWYKTEVKIIYFVPLCLIVLILSDCTYGFPWPYNHTRDAAWFSNRGGLAVHMIMWWA